MQRSRIREWLDSGILHFAWLHAGYEAEALAELIRGNNDPQKKDYLVLLDAVKNNAGWQSEDQKIVLNRVKAMMQESGDWKEVSKKKKPEQDKPHQRTLEVIRLLKEFE